MKQNKKDIILEIIRFLIVGGIATLCDYITFYLCNLIIFKDLKVTLNLYLSTTLGFTVGLFVNWFLQKFVYRYINDKQTKSKKVFIKFVVVSLIGLLITQIGILSFNGIYDKLYLTIIFKFDFWKLFIKCLMTLIVLIFNYLARKFFVFKINDQEPNAE